MGTKLRFPPHRQLALGLTFALLSTAISGALGSQRVGASNPPPAITIYRTPAEHTVAITPGPDGNIYYTREPIVGGACIHSYIGQLTPSGTITEFPTPCSSLNGITSGPDGNLWFTLNNYDAIVRMTPQGAMTQFGGMAPSSPYNNNPYGITAGADGNLWFTDEFSGPALQGRIGKMTTAGILTEYPMPATDGNNFLENIAAGPDGNLWFTAAIGNFIGRITQSGVITEFPLPTGMPGAATTAQPFGITAGPDGNVWFTEVSRGQVGRITPAGVITEYKTGTCAPAGISTGPDGNVWFTCPTQIGYVTPSGAVTLFDPFPGLDSLGMLTHSPDGTLWATDNYIQPDGTYVSAIVKIGPTPAAQPVLSLTLPTPPSLIRTAAGTYSPNPFTITATVTNSGTAATGVLLSIAISGASLAPGVGADFVVGDLGPGASATAHWQLVAAPISGGGKSTYAVTASANNATSVSASGLIKIPSIGYLPSVNGWAFVNGGFQGTPSYDQMASYYPESQSEMYYNILGHLIPSIKGELFYSALFNPTFQSGLCYGMSSASTYLYNSGAPPQPAIDIFYPLPSSAYPGPPDFTAQAVIDRFHARQFAAGGALASTVSWAQYSALGNRAAFDQILSTVQFQPEMVALGPTPTLDAPKFVNLFNRSHAVVAYAASSSGNLETIKIYDPNAPNDDNAHIDIDANGGIRLVHTVPPEVTYGNGTPTLGNPGDWVLMPLSDLAFGAASNTKWLFDLPPPLPPVTFMIGSAPSTRVGQPVFLVSGSSANPTYIQQLPAGIPYAASITASSVNSEVGQIADSHVVDVVQTDANAVGTTHTIAINADTSQVQLGTASTTEHFTVQVGADYTPNYGRRLTVSGLGLAPASTLSIGSDLTTTSFDLSATAAGQVVPGTIEQIGQSAGRANLSLVIPGHGAHARLVVADWSDLGHSLIEEQINAAGATLVIVLQDNSTERRDAISQNLGTLQSAAAAISDSSLQRELKTLLDGAQAQFALGNAATSHDEAVEHYLAAAALLIGFHVEVAEEANGAIPSATATLMLQTTDVTIGLLLFPWP